MAKDLVFTIKVLGVSNEGKRIAEIDKSLESLNKERREALKINEKTAKAREEQAKKVASLNTRIKGLREEKNKLNKTEAQSVKAFQAATGSMEALRVRTAQLRKEANLLNRTTAEGRVRYQEIRKEVQANAKEIRDFDRDLSGSSTLVGEYSKGFTQAFTAISGGILAAVAAFRTFNRVLGGSIQTFAEYETGQLNVQSLLDDFNQSLSGDTISLIKQYGLAIEDVNKAQFDAVSAGVAGGDSIQFLTTAAKLAIGGVTDLTTSVDGLTTVINAYGKSYDEAEKVASAFFTAQKFGKTTVSELAQEIGQVIPVATQLNVQYEELLAVYASLTKRGIKTSLSTTAIRATITALLKPSKEAVQTFERLGIAYGAAQVEQEGFLNVLRAVANAVEDGDTELVELIPNVRALVAAGALTNETLDETAEILEVIKSDFGEASSLTKAFALQQESLRTSLNRVKAGLDSVFINVGDLISPLIKGFADLVNPVQTTTDLMEAQRDEVFLLTAELQNENIEQARKQQIIESLNKIYPGLLTNIDQENIDTKQLTENVALYNRQIAVKIAQASLEEDQQKILGKQGQLLAKQTLEENKAVVQLTKGYAALTERFGEVPDAVSAAFDELGKVTRDTSLSYEEQTDKQNELWDSVILSLNEVNSGARIGGEQIRNQFNAASAGAKNAQRDYRSFVDKNKDALAELSEAQKILFEQLQDLGGVVTQTTEVTPETTTDGDGLVDKLPDVRKVIAQTTVRFSAEESEIFKEILAENEKVFLAQAQVADETNEELFQNQLARWNQETIEYRKKEATKEAIARATTQVLNEGLNFIFNRNRALQDAELMAAEGNAEKQEEIRRKYAKREQTIASAEAVIKAGLIILNALQTQPFIPAGLIAASAAAITAGLQVASINSQKFAGGGKVRSGNELSGFPRNGDNTPALLKPGEAVLNKSQQALMGGPDALRRAGVPGFAAGGAVPEPNTGAIDTRVSMLQSFKDLRVVLNVNELNQAEQDLAVILDTEAV